MYQARLDKRDDKQIKLLLQPFLINTIIRPSVQGGLKLYNKLKNVQSTQNTPKIYIVAFSSCSHQ